MSALPNAVELYAARRAEWERRARALGAESRRLSNLRGAVFGAAAFVVVLPLWASLATSTSVIIAGSLLAVFAVLVALHLRVVAREDRALRHAHVNRVAELRARHRYRELSDDGADLAPAGHRYAGDLDLFGPGSLFQRASVAHTDHGRKRLASLLCAPDGAAAARRRQQAVRALVPALDFRQGFEAEALAAADELPAPPPPGPSAAGRASERPASARASEPPAVDRGGVVSAASAAAAAPALEPSARAARPAGSRRRPRTAPDPTELLRWAASAQGLSDTPARVFALRALPIVTLGLCAGALSGLPLGWGFAAAIAVQVVLLVRTADTVARTYSAVSTTEGAFLRYGALLRAVGTLPSDGDLLDELRARVTDGSAGAARAMDAFRTRVSWFDLRQNGLVHPVVNLFLLWDLHCVLSLQRWRAVHGRRLSQWFSAIGEVEALSSLATLAQDEPEWAFPELLDDGSELEAEALGHPLIAPEARVVNDVHGLTGGHALLVTGSNMSGKSTFMRSLGLAVVLALAGGPVCARRLRTAAFRVETSMRVSDSLSGGVSHFYAELRRLAEVLAAARGDRPVLFLLDEILHGTNSRERQVGARWILQELLLVGSTGAISTHDMGLVELPADLGARVRMVHFQEQTRDGAMTFDYLLRPGPVRAGNALRLMRSLGLGVPLEDDLSGVAGGGAAATDGT